MKAPDWIIEMMRTGKPVKCNVGNKNGLFAWANISGYVLNGGEWMYISQPKEGIYQTWEQAEPLPEWVPKNGDVVFALDGTPQRKIWVAKVISKNGGGVDVICSDGEKSYWHNENLKPFNESDIGKPWDEI